MKSHLITFVQPSDASEFATFSQSHTYQDLRSKFIEMYISRFTKARHEKFNVQFDPERVSAHVETRINNLKRFNKFDDSAIIECVLSSIPPQVADLFHINLMDTNLVDLKNYARTLDLVEENMLDESVEDEIPGVDPNRPSINDESISLVDHARLERENLNENSSPIFMRILPPTGELIESEQIDESVDRSEISDREEEEQPMNSTVRLSSTLNESAATESSYENPKSSSNEPATTRKRGRCAKSRTARDPNKKSKGTASDSSSE